MPTNRREITFEDAIKHDLPKVVGYTKADSADSDRKRAIARIGECRSLQVSAAAVTGKNDVREEVAL